MANLVNIEGFDRTYKAWLSECQVLATRLGITYHQLMLIMFDSRIRDDIKNLMEGYTESHDFYDAYRRRL